MPSFGRQASCAYASAASASEGSSPAFAGKLIDSARPSRRNRHPERRTPYSATVEPSPVRAFRSRAAQPGERCRARLIHRLKTHFGVRMIAVILEDTMGIMNFAKRRGLSLAVAAALITAAGAAPSIAYAQHHGGGGGISTGAAVGLGLGAFALGSAAGAGAYGYPYGYGYGYYPPAAYYPPAPAYYAPRSCWDPYYRRYYGC